MNSWGEEWCTMRTGHGVAWRTRRGRPGLCVFSVCRSHGMSKEPMQESILACTGAYLTFRWKTGAATRARLCFYHPWFVLRAGRQTDGERILRLTSLVLVSFLNVNKYTGCHPLDRSGRNRHCPVGATDCGPMQCLRSLLSAGTPVYMISLAKTSETTFRFEGVPSAVIGELRFTYMACLGEDAALSLLQGGKKDPPAAQQPAEKRGLCIPNPDQLDMRPRLTWWQLNERVRWFHP